MAAKFEKISAYANHGLTMPMRATSGAAGYDFCAAEDTEVPSLWRKLNDQYAHYPMGPLSLEATADCVKKKDLRPTLVPTGVKCKLDPGTYLQLVNRSSGSYKHLLVLANGVGAVDEDYYNCADNEGHIFFQFINLSPWDIIIHKGDRIGQGIICKYDTTEDDITSATRTGGFGSSGQ